MAGEHAVKTASYLFRLFNSDTIIPLGAMAELFRYIPGIQPLFASEVISEWKKMAASHADEGKNTRDISSPVILTRGVLGSSDGESLRFYLPEEKILINRTLFRQKLSGTDLSVINQSAERKLLEELRNEAIGLSDQEVFIYYNLLKVDMLARAAGRSAPAGLHPEEAIVSSDVTIIGQGQFDYAEKILELIDRSIMQIEKLSAVNDRKPLDRALLKEAFKSKISKNIHNPKVYCLMFGYEIEKYSRFIQEYLSMTASRWGGNHEEILTYFIAYQLLSSAKPEIIDNMQLSAGLRNFINDNLGKVHPVFYCAILFITVFTYILVMQVMEISGKYFSQPEGQREKLLRLYASDERINMLVNNAFNIASGKIASFKSESREILPNMKKFLAKNSSIIVPSDMFRTRYNF